jgi:hypothetical protein
VSAAWFQLCHAAAVVAVPAAAVAAVVVAPEAEMQGAAPVAMPADAAVVGALAAAVAAVMIRACRKSAETVSQKSSLRPRLLQTSRVVWLRPHHGYSRTIDERFRDGEAASAFSQHCALFRSRARAGKRRDALRFGPP